MQNDEEKSVKARAPKKQAAPPTKQSIAPISAAPAETPLLPPKTEHFLLVEIPRGSSKDDLIRAVEAALRSKDVPLFKDHKSTGDDGTPSGADDPTCPPTTLGQGLGPDDALLLFCKQEGGP